MPDNNTKVQPSDGRFIWTVDNVKMGVIDYTGSTWGGNVGVTGILSSPTAWFQSLKVNGSDVGAATSGSFERLTVTGTSATNFLNVLGTVQGSSARFGSMLVLGTSTFNSNVRAFGTVNSPYISSSAGSITSLTVNGTMNGTSMFTGYLNVLSTFLAFSAKVTGTTVSSAFIGTNANIQTMTVGNSILMSQTFGSSAILWPRFGIISVPTGGNTVSIGSRLSLYPGYELGVGVDSDIWLKTPGKFNIFNNNGIVSTKALSFDANVGGFTTTGISRMNAIDLCPDSTDSSTIYGKAIQITRSSIGGQYMAWSRKDIADISLGYDANSNAFGIGTSNVDDLSWIPNYLSIDPSSNSVSILTTDGSSAFVVGGNTRVLGDISATTASLGNHHLYDNTVELNVYGSGSRSSILNFYGSDDPNSIFRLMKNPGSTGASDIINAGEIRFFSSGNITLQTTSTSGSPGVILDTTGEFRLSKGLSVSGTGLFINNSSKQSIVWGSSSSTTPALNGTREFSLGVGGSSMWFSLDSTNGSYNWYAGTNSIATLDGQGKFTGKYMLVSGSSSAVEIDGGSGTTKMSRSGLKTVFVDSISGTWLTYAATNLTIDRNVLVSGTLMSPSVVFTSAAISTVTGNIVVIGNVTASNVWAPWNTTWGSLSFTANTPLQVTAASSISNLSTGTYAMEFKWDSASSNYFQTILSGTFGLLSGLMANAMPNAPITLQGTFTNATSAMPTFYIRSDATSGSNGYPQLFVTFPVTVIIYNVVLTLQRIA